MPVLDSGAVVCAIVAWGMATAFLVADYRSTTTRLLALFLFSVGGSILLNILFVRPYDPAELPALSPLAPLVSALAVCAAAEWVLRIRRTVPAGRLNVRWGDAMFRIAQLMGVVYGVIGALLDEARVRHFVGRLDGPAALGDPMFWVFAAPLGLAILAVMQGTLVTLRRKPDRPEAVRLFGIAVSAPLVASGLVLSGPLAAYGSAIGEMVFLIAAVQYHVLQGQRGQFLKRFLAPSVAEMVRRQGLETAMKQRKLEISVVAADLRGYTAFAESRDSAEVLELLGTFYDVVGRLARRYQATIKDYAGDGVLVLIGAPIPVDDHAQRALGFARDLRREMARRFDERRLPLGIGAGVATGLVSVGVIGRQRLEYVAVGAAINLAARLCQQASAGEILIDSYTRDRLSDSAALVAVEPVTLKGMRGAVTPWRVPAEA